MEEVKFTGYDSVFADRLRGLMSENETTQTELAGVTGITRQAISQYMDGSIQPNIEKLYKIADFFKASADYLLGLSNVKSSNADNKEINRKLGLSDYSIDILESYNEKFNGEYLIPVINYLIEQEEPLHFVEEEISLSNIEGHLNQASANEEDFDKLSADRKKLDDAYLEWKNNHDPLLKIIEDFFMASASDEELYITGETIKKENDFKSKVQKDITTKRVVTANKVVEQVFISEIGDAVKNLKAKYQIDRSEMYSIGFE